MVLIHFIGSVLLSYRSAGLLREQVGRAIALRINRQAEFLSGENGRTMRFLGIVMCADRFCCDGAASVVQFVLADDPGWIVIVAIAVQPHTDSFRQSRHDSLLRVVAARSGPRSTHLTIWQPHELCQRPQHGFPKNLDPALPHGTI